MFRCERGRPVKVPSVESYIMVLQPQQPSIDINGTGNVPREYEDFRLGVRVFTDVHITVGQVKGQKQWKHGIKSYMIFTHCCFKIVLK